MNRLNMAATRDNTPIMVAMTKTIGTPLNCLFTSDFDLTPSLCFATKDADRPRTTRAKSTWMLRSAVLQRRLSFGRIVADVEIFACCVKVFFEASMFEMGI
jgi:hypothetical protein